MSEIENERQYIEKAVQGDSEAFAQLVENHQARLRAFAARYLDGGDDVFDVVQEAFIDAYKAMESFDTERDFGPWIRTICYNRIMKFFRSRKARRSVPMEDVDEAILHYISQRNQDDETDVDRITALKSCVDELKPKHKKLIMDRYTVGRKVKDIADGLQQSETAISMQFNRIRAALRKCLDRKYKP